MSLYTVLLLLSSDCLCTLREATDMMGRVRLTRSSTSTAYWGRVRGLGMVKECLGRVGGREGRRERGREGRREREGATYPGLPACDGTQLGQGGRQEGGEHEGGAEQLQSGRGQPRLQGSLQEVDGDLEQRGGEMHTQLDHVLGAGGD